MHITIAPKVMAKKDTYEIPLSTEELSEMIAFAVNRCRPSMQMLVDGRSLNDVLIKTYLQGFFDYHSALTKED